MYTNLAILLSNAPPDAPKSGLRGIDTISRLFYDKENNSLFVSNQTTETYQQIANEARIKVLRLIYEAQTSHVGSNFSAIDIMAVLFEKADVEKDEVVLSAGWKAAAWYYFLWKKGRITTAELESFCGKIECPDCKEGQKKYGESNLYKM